MTVGATSEATSKGTERNDDRFRFGDVGTGAGKLDGGDHGDPATIRSLVSTSALTLWATVVAGVSILLLVGLDRRKPARRHRIAARAHLSSGIGVVLGGRAPVVREVVQMPMRPYRRTPIWRRMLSIVGIGAMSTLLAAITAIIIGTLLIGGFWFLTSAVR